MVETIRVGFFNSGETHQRPVECSPGLYWASLAIKPQGKPWKTVWTATGRDPEALVEPVLGIGKALASALGSPFLGPDFRAYKSNLSAHGNLATGITGAMPQKTE